MLPGIRRVGGTGRFADVVNHHNGHSDLALGQRKLQRDQRPVELELAEQPEHPFTLLSFGSVLQDRGRHAEAPGALGRRQGLTSSC
jgi:hypothetical protein